MATSDNIGAPRQPQTQKRDKAILAEAKRILRKEKRGMRAADAARVANKLMEDEGLDPISNNQVYYALRRLAQAGLLERRDGYNWFPAVHAVEVTGLVGRKS